MLFRSPKESKETMKRHRLGGGWIQVRWAAKSTGHTVLTSDSPEQRGQGSDSVVQRI